MQYALHVCVIHVCIIAILKIAMRINKLYRKIMDAYDSGLTVLYIFSFYQNKNYICLSIFQIKTTKRDTMTYITINIDVMQ